MTASTEAAERLRTALELADIAERMFRQKLRRQSPKLSEADIERRIDEWYAKRPGAEQGDGDGVPGSWPRGRE